MYNKNKTIIRDTDNKYEKCYALDSNGNIIFEKSGLKSQISFSQDECNKIKGAKLFAHNHPSSGSFSIEDIFFAGVNDIEDIRVIAPDSHLGDVEFYAKNVKFPGVETLRNKYKVINSAIRSKLQDKVWGGKLDPGMAGKIHSHLVWKKLSKDLGWDYGYVKRK